MQTGNKITKQSPRTVKEAVSLLPTRKGRSRDFKENGTQFLGGGGRALFLFIL